MYVYVGRIKFNDEINIMKGSFIVIIIKEMDKDINSK